MRSKSVCAEAVLVFVVGLNISFMQCLKLVKVKRNDEVHEVPCGKCAFCLTNRRSEWMFRVYHEIRTSLYPGYFLTFTYDEGHVKRVAEGRLSLRFRDIQLYLKRLRKAKYYAKYICVGEYGTVTHRPHYHMLLWTDAPIAYLDANWKSSKDDSLLGRIHFGRISMSSAMYCLKYIIQPKELGLSYGMEKTRAQFSRGIGLSYLTTAVYDFHTRDYDNPILFSRIDGRQVALPRYYKKKIFTKFQLRTEALKVKFETHIKYIKERKPLLKKLGFRGAKNYMQALRIEQNNRIISKTKYGTTI